MRNGDRYSTVASCDKSGVPPSRETIRYVMGSIQEHPVKAEHTIIPSRAPREHLIFSLSVHRVIWWIIRTHRSASLTARDNKPLDSLYSK